MTVNELLDVIDRNRDGDDLIEIKGHNDDVEMSALSKSKIWDLVGDRVINSLGIEGKAFVLWLEDEQ